MVLAAAVPSFSVVLNDFEGVAGNAIDWNSQLAIDDSSLTVYEFVEEPSEGIIDGTHALHVNAFERAETLALRLTYDQRVAFMNNDIFLISVAVPANFEGSTEGWTEVTQVTVNADGLGYQAQFTEPAFFFGFYEDSPVQVAAISIDYRQAKESMPEEPGYIEIVFTTNSDGVHNDLYFDSAQIRPAASTVYETEILADNPLGWIRFEDLSSVNGAAGSFSQPGAAQTYTYIVEGDGSEINLVPSYGGLGVAAEFNPGSSLSGGDGTCVSSYIGDSVFDPNTSVEFWLNSDDAPSWCRVLQSHMGTDGSVDPNSYGFGLSSGGTLYVEGAGHTWYGASNTDLVDGQWHHVVVTFEQNGSDITERCYVDGLLNNDTTYSDSMLKQDVTHLTIGSNGNQWYMWNLYRGAVDEIAFYGSVLTQERIAAHYSAAAIDSPRTCSEVQSLGWGMQSDINKDCEVNLLDFADLASSWAVCNDPLGGESCGPTW